MTNHESEIQFILSRLGEKARGILESAGVPVEEAMDEILEKKEWQVEVTRKGQSIEIAELPIRDITTSELTWLCSLPELERETDFKQELHRRLSLLKLTEEQKEQFIALDLAALEEKDLQTRDQTISPGHYILFNTTIESLPQPSSCLLSELIVIVDDADAACAKDLTWLPYKAVEAIKFALGRGTGTPGPYIEEGERRFDLIGLKRWQRNSFLKNEALILARTKWGYSPPETSWTPESLVKKR